MKIEMLIARYPQLYHMAEKDTWPSIKARGLLSAEAVLDLHRITGKERARLLEGHRPEKESVGTENPIVLRDQKPMPPTRLAMALRDVTVDQWYALINKKVFMWAEETRLFGMLDAHHYRKLEHDVLTIDTASIVKAHAKSMWLSSINSGSTIRVPHPRGENTFMRIPQYPVKKNGNPLKEVVEVVVDYSVPDITDHVIEVRRMRRNEVLKTLSL